MGRCNYAQPEQPKENDDNGQVEDKQAFKPIQNFVNNYNPEANLHDMPPKLDSAWSEKMEGEVPEKPPGIKKTPGAKKLSSKEKPPSKEQHPSKEKPPSKESPPSKEKPPSKESPPSKEKPPSKETAGGTFATKTENKNGVPNKTYDTSKLDSEPTKSSTESAVKPSTDSITKSEGVKSSSVDEAITTDLKVSSQQTQHDDPPPKNKPTSQYYGNNPSSDEGTPV